MPYQSIYVGNNILEVLLIVAWVVAVLTIGNMVRRKTGRGLRRLALWSFVPLLAVVVLSLLRVLDLIQMAGNGFALIPVPNFWSLPLVLPPLIATLWWGFPRLWRLSRRLPDSAGETTPLKLEERLRVEAADPRLVVPVQAGAFSAFLTMLLLLAPPSTVFGVGCIVLLAAFTGWRWLWQMRLVRQIEQRGRQALLRLWQRLAWTGAFLLAIVAAFGLWFAITPQTTRLPDRYSMMQHLGEDHAAQMASGMQMVNVTDLSGPKDGTPDRRFTLVAQKTQVKLASGQTVEVWSYNGQVPGPELRVRQGDLVEVTLENRDIEEGVTIHWHGVDVPNAEDGVAGLTQDAVLPGQRFVYRFRVKESGTYWYHSHQDSLEQVERGLFGPFIVEPAQAAANVTDITVAAHEWQISGKGVMAFGLADGISHRAIAPGTAVRLRLINTTNKALAFTLNGTPFQVAAIDGVDLNGPTNLERARLTLAAGGRYDLRFTMPDQAVQLDTPGAGLALSPDGKSEAAPAKDLTNFNPASYGQPTPTPFGPTSHFDGEYTLLLESGLGFYNGSFEPIWMINGQVFPDTPVITVNEGDLIKITFVNRSVQDHPMHPHGHKMLVLRRNGQPVTGSPWWTDTLNVAPGEVIEVALKADNPGLWMDHCHNLEHAASGMMMHLMYNGVMTPYYAGRATPNKPE